MSDLRIGRIVAASLHQSITDVLPDRLEFYETFLKSRGLRDGTIGLAPITAVLGFLRMEDAYDQVMIRAGRLAADWTVASMSPLQCRLIALLPRPLRARAALRVAVGIMTHACSSTKASTRIRRTNARLHVTSSLFCSVRETQKAPLCGFYAAVASETLERFAVPARGIVERCHAVQGDNCVIAVELVDANQDTGTARAA